MGSYRDICNPTEMVSLVGVLDPGEPREQRKRRPPGMLSRDEMVKEYNEMQAEQAILLVRHSDVVRAQARCRSSIIKVHAESRAAGRDDGEAIQLFDRYMQLERDRTSLRKEIQGIRRRASYLMNAYHRRTQAHTLGGG